MRKVTIIDYGAGNILSVKRAFEFWGADTMVTNTPLEVSGAEALVLPGVGAFADGMAGLEQNGLAEAIREYADKDRPFLGICLGMQMMMDESQEFGVHKGLGLIPGKVIAIDKTAADGGPHKIPHIGWNELEIPGNKPESWWEHTILSGICQREEVYFVHSFTAFPGSDEYRLADTYYGGRQISAVIRKGNIYGCQFHPEKSGQIGLRIIKNFLELIY